MTLTILMRFPAIWRQKCSSTSRGSGSGSSSSSSSSSSGSRVYPMAPCHSMPTLLQQTQTLKMSQEILYTRKLHTDVIAIQYCNKKLTKDYCTNWKRFGTFWNGDTFRGYCLSMNIFHKPVCDWSDVVRHLFWICFKFYHYLTGNNPLFYFHLYLCRTAQLWNV